MSDQMAYSIVKTLFEKKAELVAVHKERRTSSSRASAWFADPVPSGRPQVSRGTGVKVN